MKLFKKLQTQDPGETPKIKLFFKVATGVLGDLFLRNKNYQFETIKKRFKRKLEIYVEF
jgi:hypothetical protein